MKTIDLIKAGAELNYLLGLKPSIDLNTQNLSELRNKIKESSTLLLDADEVTPETKRTLQELGSPTNLTSHIKTKNTSFKITSSLLNDVILIECPQVIEIIPLSNRILQISTLDGKY